ncbi:unnamed protein product [Gordionus sp. m RMFG-2023]
MTNYLQKAKIFKISDINTHITCSLCKGYLIDATTIIECLHSFCRSCLLLYLNSHRTCPICDCLIHKTKPILNIRSDSSLQDLVFKLIPGLYQDEVHKRKEFFLKNKKKIKNKNSLFNKLFINNGTEDYYNIDMYAAEDNINIALKYYIKNPEDPEDFNSIEKALCNYKRFLQCPVKMTILTLKMFIQKKFFIPCIQQVEIYLINQYLSDSLSLLDILCLHSLKRTDPLEVCFYIHDIYIEPKEMDETNDKEKSEELTKKDDNNDGSNSQKDGLSQPNQSKNRRGRRPNKNNDKIGESNKLKRHKHHPSVKKIKDSYLQQPVKKSRELTNLEITNGGRKSNKLSFRRLPKSKDSDTSENNSLVSTSNKGNSNNKKGKYKYKNKKISGTKVITCISSEDDESENKNLESFIKEKMNDDGKKSDNMGQSDIALIENNINGVDSPKMAMERRISRMDKVSRNLKKDFDCQVEEDEAEEEEWRKDLMEKVDEACTKVINSQNSIISNDFKKSAINNGDLNIDRGHDHNNSRPLLIDKQKTIHNGGDYHIGGPCENGLHSKNNNEELLTPPCQNNGFLDLINHNNSNGDLKSDNLRKLKKNFSPNGSNEDNSKFREMAETLLKLSVTRDKTNVNPS